MSNQLQTIIDRANKYNPDIDDAQYKMLEELSYTCSERDYLNCGAEELIFAYQLVQMALQRDFDNSMIM